MLLTGFAGGSLHIIVRHWDHLLWNRALTYALKAPLVELPAQLGFSAAYNVSSATGGLTPF